MSLDYANSKQDTKLARRISQVYDLNGSGDIVLLRSNGLWQNTGAISTSVTITLLSAYNYLLNTHPSLCMG